jgi:hypothetical protein
MRLAPDSTSSTSHTSFRFDLDLSKAFSHFTQDIIDYDSSFFPPCPSQWRHLPSSLSVTSFLTSDPYRTIQRFDAKASYRVQAHLFRHGNMISGTWQDVLIFDNMEPQPPTCLVDFSSEYLCRQERVLRKHIVSRVGVLSVTIAEPDPFLFSSGKDFAITRLPIHFGLQGSPAVPYTTSVTWRLRTATFVSVKPMTVMPTVLQACRTPSISLITTRGLRHRMKLVIRDWKKPATGSGTAWSIDEKIALAIPTRCLLPPTFITPHISRRYSLLVQVKVAGDGKAGVKLEIPVQMVYLKGREPAGVQGEMGAERDSDAPRILAADAVNDLPVYVP